MSLVEVLERRPGNLSVETPHGEIVLRTPLCAGPMTARQKRLTALGIGGMVLGSVVLPVGPILGASDTLIFALWGLLFGGGFLMMMVLNRQRRSQTLTIRANTLTDTRYIVSLDQIQSVVLETIPRKNGRPRYRLIVGRAGTQDSWDMEDVSATQAEWIADVIREAAIDAHHRFGTAADIPQALTDIQSRQQQAMPNGASPNPK